MKVLTLTLLALTSAWGQSDPQKAAIDTYINQRLGVEKSKLTPLQELKKKLDALDARLLPHHSNVFRIRPIIDNRMRILESLEKSIATNELFLDPYQNVDWKRTVISDLKKTCCEIRANPRLAREIIEKATQDGVAIDLSDKGLAELHRQQGNPPPGSSPAVSPTSDSAPEASADGDTADEPGSPAATPQLQETTQGGNPNSAGSIPAEGTTPAPSP
ncbi:MAG: hypothetical protein AB7F86_09050 [Bdellovibrionales bacterium]